MLSLLILSYTGTLFFKKNKHLLEFSFFSFLLERKDSPLPEHLTAGLRWFHSQCFLSLVLQFVHGINRIVFLPFSYSVCIAFRDFLVLAKCYLLWFQANASRGCQRRGWRVAHAKCSLVLFCYRQTSRCEPAGEQSFLLCWWSHCQAVHSALWRLLCVKHLNFGILR